MKKYIKQFGIILIVAVQGFLITASGNSAGTNISEPMSTKTAFEYFRDEGITVGINLGNSLDAVDFWTNSDKPVSIETVWYNPRVNQAVFNGFKAHGFTIVRIPVTWNGHIGPAPDYKIEDQWLKRVAEVAGYAKNAGLKAIINIHHDGHHDMGGWLLIDKSKNDPSISNKFEKVWRQIAGYFINYGDWLMFQGFNEINNGVFGTPGTSQEYKIINDWNQRFTDAVRSTGGNNALRYLIYYGYNAHYSISNSRTQFILPTDTAKGRQIVAFHYYDPVNFVMRTTTPNWGTRQEKTAIDSVFKAFKTKFINKNIPIIIGENGPFKYSKHVGNPKYNAANDATAQQSRLNYIDHFYSRARENGIVPCYWDNGSFDPTYEDGDCTLFNRNTGQPNSAESAAVIQHMISAIKNAAPQ